MRLCETEKAATSNRALCFLLLEMCLNVKRKSQREERKKVRENERGEREVWMEIIKGSEQNEKNGT